jgi:hypothetical protein
MLVINVNVNTQDDRFFLSYSWRERINFLIDLLGFISQSRAFLNSSNQPFRAMLIAPEYFFARSCPEFYSSQSKQIPPERIGRHYSYEEYIEIRQALTKLSYKYPEILIVPGTIAWKEQAVSPNTVVTTDGYEMTSDWAYVSSSPVPYWKEGVRFGLTQRDAYNAFILSIGENPCEKNWYLYLKENPDSKLLAANERLYSTVAQQIGAQGLTLDGKQRILQNKRDAFAKVFSSNPEKYIKALAKANFGLAWNSAFFYLNGKMVGSYSKHSDYQEVIFHEELSVAIPSEGTSVLNIRGLSIGVEICLDHVCNPGILKSFIASKKLPFFPDIHLVLSAYVRPVYNCARANGYFIHASSEISLSGCVLNDCQKGIKCNPIDSFKYSGLPVSIYDIIPAMDISLRSMQQVAYNQQQARKRREPFMPFLKLELTKSPSYEGKDFQGGKITMSSDSDDVFRKVRNKFLELGESDERTSTTSSWFYPKIETIMNLNKIYGELPTLLKDLPKIGLQDVISSFKAGLDNIKRSLISINITVDLELPVITHTVSTSADSIKSNTNYSRRW